MSSASRERFPVRLLAVGAGVLLALVCALASAAPAKPRKCAPGTLTVTHPHGCIPRRLVLAAIAPREGLAAHARDLTTALLYPPNHAKLPARDRALAHTVLRDLAATFPKLVRADANGPPYPSGRLRARDTLGHVANLSITQTVSGPGGFTATGTGQVIDAKPGQTGDEISIAIGARVDRNAASADLSQGVRMGAFADLCPNANGEVDGSGVARSDISGGFTAGSKAASFSVSVVGESALRGRVGEDGKLIDYSLVYDGTSSYDGPARGLFGIGHYDAHSRARTHMVFDHLRVGVPISDADFERQWKYETSGFGLAGFLSGAYKAMIEAQAVMVYVAKHFADEALTKAQRNWYDNAACLKAKFDPDGLQDVPPGSRHDVAVSVHSVSDSQPVSMPVTLSASPGKVTPADAQSGSSPIQASLTVSDKPNDTTTLYVAGVSKRGRLTGDMTATTAPKYTVLYTPSSTANTSYPYDQSTTGFVDRGTYSEQRNLLMTASVPTSAPGPGQPATGTGPLAWQGPSWTIDDVNTTNGQGSSTLCTIDYKRTYTAFAPGTLQVKSLTVGTPGPRGGPNIKLDVVVNGVGEHYHLAETPQSGPCPGIPNDGDGHYFESELSQMHQAVGDKITPVGQGFELQLSGGWRPGTGNVLATRTVTWSHGGERPGGPANTVRDRETFQIIRAG